MLTHNDVTVENAYDVFMSSWDLDVNYWGFKNTGLNNDQMNKLINAVKEKGKAVFMEVVTYDEASCLESVKTAAENKIDGIMGTVYFPSVHTFLKDNNISYKPFVGKVSGGPSILEGAHAEIIDNAKRLMEKGITGFDILAYRHKKNGEQLARRFCEEINAEICVAGSISNFERIDAMLDIAPWGFTMGSALFERRFAPRGAFRENLQVVVNYIKSK